MSSDDWFLFSCCQQGAEPALKAELAHWLPESRFAYSRAGFCTFKIPASQSAEQLFQLPLVFARTRAVSLGTVQGVLPEQAAAVAELIATVSGFKQLHVWSRDSDLPGNNGFEPGPPTSAAETGQLLVSSLDKLQPGLLGEQPVGINRNARPGQKILDLVQVEPDQWWVGWHLATGVSSRWAGGVHARSLPPHAVSRAYLKIDEAIRWSRLPVKAGHRCAEVGSAPGGSCQALLDRGLKVVGIDPAEMDPRVVALDGFVHIKKRLKAVPRRDFNNIDWLFVDANVAPRQMLDDVEQLVAHKSVRLRGMLLTLKLLQWQIAAEIPTFIERVRSWGFRDVRVRQLAHNRREVCLAALKSRSFRRSVPRRS
jgi:23S rRNA (cytidine2498-2'-O)-methyltransferase